MEAVDLYGDLEDPFFFKDQSPQPSSQNSEVTVAPSSAKVEEIQQQNEKLKQQNTALKMNISCLYKTARSELERKEAMIERLMARVKKLEAASAEQQQQAQAQAQATSTALTEAQLAAAAYYQAQFMLLANSAASATTASDGTGATVDSNALSEYYRQVLGYVWNDRTPTSSDVEDAGTPLPSDKEDEKEEGCPRAGEIQASSDQPSEPKTKDKGMSKGERERRKVKRSRKHKRVSIEDPSSAMATENDICGATQNGDSCRKPLSEQENAVVGNNHKLCNTPGDNRTEDHQSDTLMEISTNAKMCAHSTTNGAGLVSEIKGHHSPPREKPSPRRYRETKELHRKEQEPHREMKEAQRLHSSSQLQTNSPIQESVNNQHQFKDNSASSHDMKVYHSADTKEVNCNSCSPKGEKQSLRRERRDREKNELQREMKEYRRASMDIQGSASDSHRENHFKRSHSSSHSPTGENISVQSSMLALNADTKAHTRGNGIISSHHTPRIEKHSPKRHREDRETNKSYREMNEPYGEARPPPRETRTHREECIELREGHRKIKDTHQVMVEPHRETNGLTREVHKEIKEPHRELKNIHRVMMEPPRVTKEAHRDMREAHRGVMGTQRETRVMYKEIREPQRGMREADRETMEACRDPRMCRNFQEPQSDTMELHRDRRMATREAYGDRGSSHNRRSHSSSRLSSSSRHRSRSPSYDKENIRRPPSLGREGRPRREPMDARSGRGKSLERTNEDLSSRRRLIRKRKLSSSSQSTSQHNQKQARREGYHQDSSRQTNKDRHSRHTPMRSRDSSPKPYSNRVASPVCYSPDFDDITNPPTPNADDILPYSADVQLCENSAVLPCDDSGAIRNMSDIIACPPTPTNELQRHKQTTNKDMERESNTNDSENKPQENLNSKQSNVKIVELKDQKKPEPCLDGGDNPLPVASDTTVFNGGGSKMEGVVKEDGDEKEASDLEEGEITDSDSDSGGETEPAIMKETRGDDGSGTCVKRRQVNISANCQSQEVEKQAYCEQLMDERRQRRSSCHGSAGHHHYRERRSPRASRHTPLSERRNRRSPPSLKKRTELPDQDGRMHSHSERHAQCHHSSRHLRSNCNLPGHIY